MAGASINNLMQGLNVRNSLPTATKTSILDRHHYTGHGGGDWQTGWTGSGSGGSHHYSGGGGGSSKGKSSVALSALTLLAFLFFLNILQNCIQDHLNDMNGDGTSPMILVPARRVRKRVGRSVLNSDIHSTHPHHSAMYYNALTELNRTNTAPRIAQFYALLEHGLRTRHGNTSDIGTLPQYLNNMWMMEGTTDGRETETNSLLGRTGIKEQSKGQLKGDIGEELTTSIAGLDGGLVENSIERNFIPRF